MINCQTKSRIKFSLILFLIKGSDKILSTIYFLIALFATTIGALTGIGGGVIIKPVLDLLGNFDVSTISVLSSFTVFSMAIVSIIRQSKENVKMDKRKTIIIGIGSVFGGFIGQYLLDLAIKLIINPSIIKIIQNTIMIVLLVFVHICTKRKNKEPLVRSDNRAIYLLIGVILGILASFLGVGGGPINVAIFALVFSMDAKESAINSIITIFFSLASKLVTVAVSTGFAIYDLRTLPFMVLGGILGGILGSSLNKKFQNKTVEKCFSIVMLMIMSLNIYNIVEILSY